ncbi:ATP-dependent zinc protease [Shewanella submarina]|uniref:ATP-dependent zinc protease n=1 Tax=Shewanella submarina TaxID=2016376 RepID=A0ABV7GFI0_9GAMM|nr:ATP-dependent zinc protease [Shewanella submarina]MCL1039220.1 ATP-dependent zinc protease [Shewanella submarina]
MLKPRYTAVLAAILLSGCAATQNSAHTPAPVDAETLETSLAANNQVILDQVTKANQTNSAALADIQSQLSNIQKHISVPAKEAEPRIIEIPAKCPETLGDKFLLGEVEYVFVEEFKTSFNTRIDTGAESSSIDARNIILFERDGNQWVRFDIFTKGEKAPAQTFESRVERFVRIKQDAENGDDRRPVIRAHLKIGKYAAETDLNLTDRSHLEYPLLLGRKFMKDIAVVDVSQSYIHGKSQPAPANKEQ